MKKPDYALLKKIGYDIIPVVAGILIALFIDNIRSDYRDKKLARATLTALAIEFQENAEEVEYTLAKRSAFLDTLTVYLEHDSLSMHDIIRKAGGISTPDITTTNWQATLNNNGLSFLDFETVSLLSRIEVQHRLIRNRTEFIQQQIYDPALFLKDENSKARKLTFVILLQDYLASERKLLPLYASFLEKVG